MQIRSLPENLPRYRTYLEVEKNTHEFLQANGYLKIDLPVLSPALIPESYLEIFETEFKYFGRTTPLYLTPSPELFLKRLMAYGIGNCYYLGKSFRNSEPNSDRHAFEFTMLEFYRTHADYMDIADDLLAMLRHIAPSKAPSITYKGVKTDLSRWERLTVADAFLQYAQIGKEALFNNEGLLEQAEKKGYRTTGFTYEDLFSQIYTQEVEPHLGMNGYPTLLYDYPKQFAALAKLNSDGRTAQRFEFYIGGVELGDCYSELTDPKEQEMRFESEAARRRESGKAIHPIDKGFIEALQYGLVESAGIAIGFDRLAMVFADADSIESLKLINIG